MRLFLHKRGGGSQGRESICHAPLCHRGAKNAENKHPHTIKPRSLHSTHPATNLSAEKPRRAAKVGFVRAQAVNHARASPPPLNLNLMAARALESARARLFHTQCVPPAPPERKRKGGRFERPHSSRPPRRGKKGHPGAQRNIGNKRGGGSSSPRALGRELCVGCVVWCGVAWTG
jgi:hypothetical protein